MAENPPSKPNLIYKMKVTKKTLQRLIKEELKKTLLREYEEGAKVFRSPNPFTGFRDTSQTGDPDMKPKGLWYSCGSEWDDFCQMGMPEWIDGAPYVYKLQINPSNMLLIRTGEELMAFHEKYEKNFYGMSFIDWAAVAQQYDGIEICPYQMEYRYDLLWYHGWDVASGCIWRAGAFLSAEQIEDPCRSA